MYSSAKVSIRTCSCVIVRLAGLGAEPSFQRLLEAFDLAAGGGMVRAGVLLHDVALAQFGLECGAAATAAGEADGVDQAVVGQVDAGYPCRPAVCWKVAMAAVIRRCAEMCRA